MKKFIPFLILFFGLAGCATSATQVESTIESSDHTISMMTGDRIDFTTINPNIVDVKILEYTTKDNIEDAHETEREDGLSYTILRSNGRITAFSLKDTSLRIITSDGEDKAKVEVIDKDGNSEIYTIVYDCGCA